MNKLFGLLTIAAVFGLSGVGSAEANSRHYHRHGMFHHWHHNHCHRHHHYASNQDNIFYTELGAYYDIEEDHPAIDNEPVYFLATQDEEPAYMHHHAYIRRHFHH